MERGLSLVPKIRLFVSVIQRLANYFQHSMSNSDWVQSVAYPSYGSRIVSGSKDETIRVWNAESGEHVGEPILGHEGDVSSVGFSSDGKQILSGSEDNTARVWDAVNGKHLFFFPPI